MALNDDLYREVILDHSQNPRHAGELPGADVVQEGVNASCGDNLMLWLKTESGVVSGIGIEATGCSISQASASMLAEVVKGKPLAEVEEIIMRVKAMLKGENHDLIDEEEDLAALEGVRKYPVRVKCALLAWNTLQQAIAAASADKRREKTEGLNVELGR